MKSKKKNEGKTQVSEGCLHGRVIDAGLNFSHKQRFNSVYIGETADAIYAKETSEK